MADALTILELLAREASMDQFEALTTAARQNGVTGERMEELESAKRLGLMVYAVLDRRRQREAALSALVDTARDLAALYDLDTLLKVTTRRARLLLGVDMSYICLPEDGPANFVIRAADGHTSTLSVGLRLPVSGGLGRAVLSDPAPFWTPDYLADDSFPHSERVDEVVRAEGLRAVMAVPLACGNQTFGVLYVADRTVRHFKVDEISLLTSLGNLAGVMIERAQLHERTIAAAAELERRANAAGEHLARVLEQGDTHARLIDVVLGGGCDLQTLTEEASQRLGAAVRLCASTGTVLAEAGDLPDGGDAMLQATMDAHAAGAPVPREGDMWAAPIFAGNEHLGTLVVYPDDPLTEEDQRLLRLVTQAVAVLLLLDNKAAIAEGNERVELLNDLLASPPRPPRQLAKRARRLGIDLDRPHVIVIARTEEAMRGKGAVWASSYAHHVGGLNTTRNGSAVLLLPGTDAGAMARTVANKLSPLLDQPVTVSGAGPVHGAGAVYHGFQEALRCLDAMTVIGATGSAASARELGFFGVLLSDSPDVEGFIGAAIGPVIDYDRQRSTELARTLDAYFETGGSPTYSAEKLHVHPNTVARRLERVGELLGPEWQQPARALDIQLALRLFRLRHHLSAPRPAVPPR